MCSDEGRHRTNERDRARIALHLATVFEHVNTVQGCWRYCGCKACSQADQIVDESGLGLDGLSTDERWRLIHAFATRHVVRRAAEESRPMTDDEFDAWLADERETKSECECNACEEGRYIFHGTGMCLNDLGLTSHWRFIHALECQRLMSRWCGPYRRHRHFTYRGWYDEGLLAHRDPDGETSRMAETVCISERARSAPPPSSEHMLAIVMSPIAPAAPPRLLAAA
jgi:hypothetical protein